MIIMFVRARQITSLQLNVNLSNLFCDVSFVTAGVYNNLLKY